MELNNSKIKIKAKKLNVFYGKKQALFDINLDINQKLALQMQLPF